jgi:hypothetical protein
VADLEEQLKITRHEWAACIVRRKELEAELANLRQQPGAALLQAIRDAVTPQTDRHAWLLIPRNVWEAIQNLAEAETAEQETGDTFSDIFDEWVTELASVLGDPRRRATLSLYIRNANAVVNTELTRLRRRLDGAKRIRVERPIDRIMVVRYPSDHDPDKVWPPGHDFIGVFERRFGLRPEPGETLTLLVLPAEEGEVS